MRVAHISYYYGNNISGAPIAALRLHNALLRRGIDSHFVCAKQNDQGVNVHRIPQSKILGWMVYVLIRGIWALSQFFCGRIFMANMIPLPGFYKKIKEIDPDVVHIHFVSQDMVSFGQLTALRLPLAFTLHDLSMVNAVEPYPGADKRYINGFQASDSSVIERWLWRRKKRFVEMNKIFFSGPSNWVCSAFENSVIGKGRNSVLIPNLIDPAFGYKPDRYVPHPKFKILFGAFKGRKSPLKGWNDLVNALKVLPEEIKSQIEVCVFGENRQSYIEEGVRVCFAGSINNPSDLRDLHHKVDIFALPSKQDNAPQVKFEALVDGLPIIAFERTGCAEYLENGVNGWVAPDGDWQEYARGILHFYDMFAGGELLTLRQQIARESMVRFSEDEIIGQYLKFYEDCLKA